jgi:hypothetical protein
VPATQVHSGRLRAQNQPADEVGGVLGDGLGDVAEDPAVMCVVERLRRSLTTLRWDVVVDGDGGPGVAESVDGETGERRVGVRFVVLVLFAEELSAESFGVVVGAVFEAEDVVAVLVGGAEGTIRC